MHGRARGSSALSLNSLQHMHHWLIALLAAGETAAAAVCQLRTLDPRAASTGAASVLKC